MQKFRKEMTREEIAVCYYSIIASINKIELKPKELALLSAMAVDDKFNRNEWIEKTDSSINSFYNMRSVLTKRQLLIKGRVNPAILPDFSSVKLEIQLDGKNKE